MTAVAVLLGLGAAAQWLAWRLKLPSILLLLAFGFAAGRGRLGWVDPGYLLGEHFFPIVSLAVGVILFEGGLSLRFREIREHGRVVILLVSVGAAVTGVLTAVFAGTVLGLVPGLAVLLGAVLIVSGPTVVLPLLRHIQPRGPTGPILKWEGIVIDPVGAVAALLVYEALERGGLEGATTFTLGGIWNTLLSGLVLGSAGAGLVITMLKRYWMPDHLQVPFALAVVVGAFAAANGWQEESGLLAVTVLGVILANQRWVPIAHILEFKENLRVLLISVLFLLLAARLQVEQLEAIGWREFVFLALLILVVRPACVLVCTWRSALGAKERLFLAWMCPRGIVAAAVASVFALGLEQHGHAEAERIVPITFLVIVGTVVVYGLTAPLLARRLGLSTPDPQGLLVVGAHPAARSIAEALGELGIRVLLTDTNRTNVRKARMQGLEAWHGNVLAEEADDALDLSGIGRVLALTPNDDVNRLATLHFLHEFGRRGVFRLARHDAPEGETEAPPPGRVVFGEGTAYEDLWRYFGAGARVKVTRLGEEFGLDDLLEQHGDGALVLFFVDPAGKLSVNARDSEASPKPGWSVVAVVPRDADHGTS